MKNTNHKDKILKQLKEIVALNPTETFFTHISRAFSDYSLAQLESLSDKEVVEILENYKFYENPPEYIGYEEDGEEY